MGITDILNGMLNGPRGQKTPQASDGKGMSPITMALLALLAYKAWQHMGAGNTTAPQGSPFPPIPGGTPNPGETTASTGGLGDLLGGILGKGGSNANSGGGLGGLLGGILAGGAAGSVISGGLGELLKQLQQHGQGQTADSWVGTGTNKPIAPKELESALGGDTIDALVRQTGSSKSDVLAELSKSLPGLVDMLTPDGRLPTEKELQRFL